jgi:hypothetical protein
VTRFEPLEAFHGFDKKQNWQMVPLGGSRGLRLLEGPDMDLVVWRRGGTIGGVTFDEVAVPMPGQREIWVQGHALGEYVLEAHDRGSGKIQAKADLEVLREREIKIAYFNVSDMAGHETEFSQTPQLHKMANAILFPQANIKCTSLGLRWASASIANLGDSVDVDASSGILRSSGSHESADLQVYFVWRIKSDEKGKPPPLGITLGGVTLISPQPSIDGMAATLAHEIGHFAVIGSKEPNHDMDSKENLMYKTSPHGTYMSRERILRTVIRSF